LFRTVTLPTLRHFGVEDGLSFKIAKRGAPPQGGGQVEFTCPIVKALKPIQLTADSKVKRIRGVAYTARVSPQFANRMVDTSKGTLTKFSGDVYIYTDHYKGTCRSTWIPILRTLKDCSNICDSSL
jgi:RNA 3'-terminal phosphate cyclase-like protein